MLIRLKKNKKETVDYRSCSLVALKITTGQKNNNSKKFRKNGKQNEH